MVFDDKSFDARSFSSAHWWLQILQSAYRYVLRLWLPLQRRLTITVER